MENMNIAIEKVTAILSTNACAELKDAARKWLDATSALLAEIREDVASIDGAIGFFASDRAKQIFGEEKAAAMLRHSQETKAAGARYCDCPGCAAGVEVLKLYGED